MFKNFLKRNPVEKTASNANPKQPADSATPVLEVFRSHWRQASVVVRQAKETTRPCTSDDVNLVVQNVEKMSDLLVREIEENSQQGECLVYLLTEDIIGQLVEWCLNSGVYENKIKYELLKIFETMISQSQQPLLYHKPVIKPLLTLLSSCSSTTNSEIEKHVILLLHQLSVCISRNPQYLELFFHVSFMSGQGNFLIFCLLIPYIHKEGKMGQQARDALLLIMAASARNEVIGKYIASNSDFCPVLATGLSGLYSSLPHKIRPVGQEDWYRIEKDQYMHMPDVQMIINCLEFCDAVVQVAHALVGQQLIDFIYNGFLVPVLAPSLLQSSIEEQVSAIAYLELFVRTVTDPSLLRAFLHFILTTKYDDVILVDWLIEKISSSTKLSMVSLSLFKTLIELNCEDVMFSLSLRYLYKQTHVMQSQRRSIKELDIYGKIADKFLQLEPDCCKVILSDQQQKLLATYNDGVFLSSSSSLQIDINDYKSSYMDYLLQAKEMIACCSAACSVWCYPYDGELPPHNAALELLPVPRSSEGVLRMMNKYDTPNTFMEDDVSLLSLNMSSASSTPYATPAKRRIEKTAHLAPNLLNLVEQPLIDIGCSNNISSAEAASADIQPLPLTSDTNDDDTPLLDLNQDDSVVPLSDNYAVPSFLLNLTASPIGEFVHVEEQPLSNSIGWNGTSEPLLSETQTSNDIQEHSITELKGIDSKFNSSKSYNYDDDTFFKFLDESVERVELCSSKTDEDVFEEVDHVIRKAESTMKTKKASESTENRLYTGIPPTDPNLQTQQMDPVELACNLILSPSDHTKKKSCNLKIEEAVDPNPNIGPFLITILGKLENMMNNTLSVNLLLTGLIARMACYPQPIMRSFLLNHSLVFQPTVKSLIQVLSSVKQKVDAFAANVSNFNVLLLQARRIMLDKLDTVDGEAEDCRSRSASVITVGTSDSDSLDIFRSPAKKKIKDFFKKEKPDSSRLTMAEPELVLDDTTGLFKFTNIQHLDRRFESPQTRLAAINTKKAVYCALVLEEFVKELAALSQEHAVQSDEGYHTD